MLSVVRSGPQTIIAGTDCIEEAVNKILDIGGELLTCQEAYQEGSENTTILALTSQKQDNIFLEELEKVFFFDCRSSQLLIMLIQDKINQLFSFIRLAPRLIMLRVLGNSDKIIEEVKKDYEAVEGHYFDLLSHHNSGTVVWFTDDNLSKNITLDRVYEKALYIDRDDKDLLREIKNHDLKYINRGVAKKSWHEITIKIYDAAGNYMLHYERLVKVIQALDLGVVLGESWGKDSATVFLSVGVYKIRLFTFHNPKFIKKIMMGLEYDEDGSRFVDLDVYHHFMKIGSTDVREKGYPSKKALAEHYREYILDHLSVKVKNKFLAEEKIISELNDI